MNQKTIEPIPQSYQYKFSVVGDLMADVALEVRQPQATLESPLVGLFVGSKPAKLSQGVPLCLAIAEQIQQQQPQTRFMIPVAPTLDLATLNNYADRQKNPLISSLGNVTGRLVTDRGEWIVTSGGTAIELVTEFPAYQTIVKCQICLTTVGANTAELTALQVPMIVLLPTQQLDAMRSWDGLPGILANLPGLGWIFARLINWLVLKQGRLFAWPNIWAGREIVPELVGKLDSAEVARMVLDYLRDPAKLEKMRVRLSEVRGQTGAAQQIADIISQEITKT